MADRLTLSTTRVAAVAPSAVTLAVAAACWFVTIRQMHGMDMGAETELGSFRFFVPAWIAMMAAMMLPGAAPAAGRVARSGAARTVPVFLVAYLAVWAVVGLCVYELYRPHSAEVAGVLVIAAGAYELTPLKRHCRERCRDELGSGLQFGRYCVGSSLGLMVVLLAVGVMNPAWTAVVAVVVLVQKLLPAKAIVDVPVAMAIVVLGALIM